MTGAGRRMGAYREEKRMTMSGSRIARELCANNKVCHKLPYETGEFRHAVLANNVCHKILANGLASFACNNKVCHSLDGRLGAQGSAYNPKRTPL